MAELDKHLLAPARLKLTTMLTAVSEIEFVVLRNGLGVSYSVLSKHVAALADAGYVRSRKAARDGRRTTRVALSPTDCKALRNHVVLLRARLSPVSTEVVHGPEKSPEVASR